jgi:basic membrane protein A
VKNRKLTASAGLVAAVAVAATALIATGVSSAAPSAGFKMAIVTDIGSLQDRSFNQLANTGRIRVGKELGIPTLFLVSK